MQRYILAAMAVMATAAVKVSVFDFREAAILDTFAGNNGPSYKMPMLDLSKKKDLPTTRARGDN
jgi:hypothetical protein